jgi:lipoprotein NlpI
VRRTTYLLMSLWLPVLALAQESKPEDQIPAARLYALMQEYEGDRAYEQALEICNELVKRSKAPAKLIDHRGDLHFFLSRFKESIADYDTFLKAYPEQFPYHWRRGMTLYYASEFQKGVEQFESHKAVNPHDVENAVWHFICKARASSLDEARKQLIPIQGDGRIPMMTVHALFAQKATVEDVLKDAETPAQPGRLKTQRFYAHLYLGIYHEILGDTTKAAEHIKLAANDYFQPPSYMGESAKVHERYLKQLGVAKDAK